MGISTLPPPEERPTSGQEALARLRASRDQNAISSGHATTSFNPSPRTYQQQEVGPGNAGGFVSPRSPSGGLGIDPNLLRPRNNAGVPREEHAQHVHFDGLPTAAEYYDEGTAILRPKSKIVEENSNKSKKKRKTLLEKFLRKVQQPEVILLAVWWVIMLVTVITVGDFWDELLEIWQPLVGVLAIPVVCFIILLIVTL